MIQFFAGALMFAGIVMLIPEPNLGPSLDQIQRDASLTSSADQQKSVGPTSAILRKQRQQVMFSGIVTAVGISIHNFPEGVAVFLGSLKVQRGHVSLWD